MKKTKILGIILVIVLIMQVLVACGPTAEITFPTESVDCVVGAKTVLKPKVVNGSTADIVWTSSDESVATVSGGKVVGKKVGQAVITATIGKSSSSVKINVTTNQLSYKDGTEIRMGVAHNSNSTTISFKDPTVVGDGLTLADGKTYHLGDLKPVWSELQNRLNVKLNNVYTGASSAQNEYLAWQKLNFAGVDVVVGNASDITVDGKNGKILDLNQYLPMMPNFYQFLQANPTVYMSLISDTSTGSIYYAPYFDGYDDIEKYFLMRTDWVEFLLNGPTFVTPVEATIDEWDSAKAQYTNYVNATATTKIEVESLTKDGTGTQKITKDYSKTGGKTAVDYINAAVESNKDAQGKVK
ncbi:MAG: Ig-like domain-containing protein, partial [Clostridia bacterium]